MTDTSDQLHGRLPRARGIDVLLLVIDAQSAWSRATPAQRQLMVAAGQPLVDAVRAIASNPDGAEPGRVGERPVISASARTLASMRRKRLVDGDHRLTVEAINAVFWCNEEDGDGW